MPQKIRDNSIKNTSGIMILLVIISCLSKVLGFTRDIVLTDIYGASSIADAYLATLSIPDMLLDLLANTTMIGLVPIAVEKIKHNDSSVNSFVNSVLKILLSVGVILVLLLVFFPGFVINILAPGFTGETKDIAILFLRIISLTILFRTVANIFNAFLNANKVFIPGAFLGIILDMMVILGILLSNRTDLIYILPLGAVLGTLAQMAFISPFTIKNGYHFQMKSSLWNEDIKSLLVMIIPASLSVGLMQISSIVNKALASNITTGGITMLNQATKISYFAENIVVASIVTVLYPLLSELYIKKDVVQFSQSIEDAVDKLITFLLPVTAGLAFLSFPIIDVLYGHGEFTEANVKTTAILMMISSLGIVGIAIQTLLTRALFSMKKVKLSAIISISLLCTFVFLSIAFSKIFGLNGIAIGTSVSYSIGGITYYCVMRKLCPEIDCIKNLKTFIKALFGSALMLIVMYGVNRWISCSNIIAVLLLTLVGFIVYLGFAQIADLKDMKIKSLVSVLKKHK